MTTQTNSLDDCGWRNLRPQLEGQREQQIRECAYFKALKRHFGPCHELDDWLSAEIEVDEWFGLVEQG